MSARPNVKCVEPESPTARVFNFKHRHTKPIWPLPPWRCAPASKAGKITCSSITGIPRCRLSPRPLSSSVSIHGQITDLAAYFDMAEGGG